MKENSIEDIIEEKYIRYLNCETDILDLTLEEAKFILETDERRNYVTSILQEAGKVILSDYKRVLEMNEILLKENEELRIKNNAIKRESEAYAEDMIRLDNELNQENKRCMMLAIEKQDYFEKYRYHLQQNESLTKEFSNVIPVQKIKDELEELKGKLEDISKRREKSKTKEEETVLWCLEIRTDERIKTLQELL